MSVMRIAGDASLPDPGPDGDRRAAAVRRFLLWVLCTYGCIHLLYYIGHEGSWLPLADALALHAQPPFNHRVLFVLLARVFQRLHPSFHPAACYFLSQIVAAAAAFWLIEPWARRFVSPRMAEWSRPLLLLLLIPTFTYWTFYDIGVVFFYTAAMLALVSRRPALFLLAFAAGTLNHENILLMVPVAIALRLTQRTPLRSIVAWTVAELAVYGALRFALFRLLPETSAWQSGKFAYNLALFAHPQSIAKTTVWLLGWGAIALTGRRRLHRDLIVMGTVLLAGIGATTLVFGQFNELRLFDGFLPVAIAAILTVMSPDATPAAATGARPA